MSDDPILDLLLEWEERRRQGNDVAPEELCHANPELLHEVTKRIEQLKATVWMQRELTDPIRPTPIRLKGSEGAFAGRLWSFGARSIRVGRLPSLELFLDEPSVSRRHAIILWGGHSWRVRDEGSTNGTFVNGIRVYAGSSCCLRLHDIVRFGQVVLAVDSLQTELSAFSGASCVSEAKDEEQPAALEIVAGMFQWGRIRIGQPARYRSLTVFPLYCEEIPAVEYLLCDEAVEAGIVAIAEVSQQGSVAELSVENRGEIRILLLEGEELRGAKQNRILNTSVLVPPRSVLQLPVSCVEQGRWRQTSATFSPSKAVCPYQLRRTLKASVARSLQRKQGHSSDQHTIWEDVRSQQITLSVTSPTSSLADTLFECELHRADAYKSLGYVEGSSGLAVAIGTRVVTVDVFNKPATCKKVWNRLLSGLLVDDMLRSDAGGSPDPASVLQLFHEFEQATWTQTQAVGEGQEFRAEINGKVASALLHQGSLVHGSVVGGWS
jgi:hypothetical protein